jgi:hypothetical protein
MIDIFISFKNSYLGRPTKDKIMAELLYDKLKEEGIETFFSNSTLSEQGASEYKNSIDAALSEAKILILVGSNKEFITSRWVQYEWNTFMQEILSERKKNGKIFTYLDSIIPADLPIGLRSLQSFSTEAGIGNIIAYVKNSLKQEGGGTRESKELSEGIFAYYGIKQKANYQKAFEILQEYPNDRVALFLLGQMYYYGNISGRNVEKAIEFYNKSAAMQNVVAAYKLAECYKRGIGVAVNFQKYDEIKGNITQKYLELMQNINKPNFEYANNLVYLGRTNKNIITKEATLALEIRFVLKLLNIDIELFDIDIDNEGKKRRIDEIRDERSMFIFSSLKNVNDNRMETIWRGMFVNYELASKLAVTHISEIQTHDIPAYLRRIPFIVRDENSMKQIVGFFMRGKSNAKN